MGKYIVLVRFHRWMLVADINRARGQVTRRFFAFAGEHIV